jgi:hypothetical protein
VGEYCRSDGDLSTPWFNFADLPGQQQVLLFALESNELQSPVINKPRVPLKDIASSAQNPKPPKRKLSAGWEQSNKRKKGEQGRDRAKEASGMV